MTISKNLKNGQFWKEKTDNIERQSDNFEEKRQF